MGAVSCKMDGAFVQNPKRFNIREITAHVVEDEEDPCGQILLKAEFDKESSQPILSRPDGRPVEYVDIQGMMMPKLPQNVKIALRFRLAVMVTPSSPVYNVTFVTGNTRREVDSFVATELVQNANIQNEKNVTLLGDFAARNDAPDIISHTFIYPLPLPGPYPAPIHFVFCEYDKNNHSLQPLGRGSFYFPEGVDQQSQSASSPLEAMSPYAAMSPLRDFILSPTRDQIPSIPLTTSHQPPVVAPQQPQPPTASRNLGPMSGHSEQFEDGPLFRSKVSAMERRSPFVKTQVKLMLKRALVLHDQLKEAADAIRWFSSGVTSAPRSEIPSLSILGPLLTDHSYGLGAARNLILTVCAEFAALVITPLRNLYEFDIKPLEFRKKDFEEESSQYYSWMSRYLSTKRDRRDKTIENDAKYLEKRLAFETSRFDYYNALLDVHAGKKMQHIAYQLALFSQRWTDLTNGAAVESNAGNKNTIIGLVDDLRQATKDWARYDQEREDRRRHLERFADPNATFTLSDQTLDEGDLDGMEAVQDEAATHKEGLLWALSRPGGIAEAQNLSKQGIKWHKYWIVQDGGKLWEYANWKQGMDLHNEPIDLKVARVREANPADRRFCFEIITPNYKRVYQATNEEDLKSWITYINRGISSSLENFSSNSPNSSSINGFSQSQELNVMKPRDTIEKIGENIGRKLSLKTGRRQHTQQPLLPSQPSQQQQQQTQQLSQHQQHHQPQQQPLMQQHQQQQLQLSHTVMGSSPNDRSVYASPIQTSIPNPPPVSKSALVLLTSLQKIPSNRQCAECETTKGVEWVSINLLVLLCISCSGSHRSLGSHISKVRSLTLDTVSFTKDLVDGLKDVSNSKLNSIWEARLDQKPLITDRNRLQFISEKYVEKVYIREIDKPNAALRRAVAEQDIIKVCTALAARANPNAASDDGEPLLVYALRCSVGEPASFKVAEILIVNGATIPDHIPTDLSAAAQKFLETRSRT